MAGTAVDAGRVTTGPGEPTLASQQRKSRRTVTILARMVERPATATR